VFFIVLKIDRESEGQECVVFVLSGRIQSEDVVELRKLISAEKQKVVLDMKQVNLALHPPVGQQRSDNEGRPLGPGVIRGLRLLVD
jgi:hypothetical protein